MKDMIFGDYFLELFQIGDFQALAVLYKLAFNRIFDLAFQLTRDQDEAEIIALYAFKSLFKMRKTIWDYKNILAFLYITTRQNALEAINKTDQPAFENSGKEPVTRVSDESNIIELETALTSPVKTNVHLFRKMEEVINSIPTENKIKGQALLILKEAGKMPENCGKVFHMMYGEGYKNDDITKVTDLGIRAIRNAEIEAMRILKEKFSKKDVSLCLLYLRWIDKR